MAEKRSPRHCPGCHGHPYNEWADCGDADCGAKDEDEEPIACEGFDVIQEIRAAEVAALEWASGNHYHECSICGNGGECTEHAAIRAEIEQRKRG